MIYQSTVQVGITGQFCRRYVLLQFYVCWS